MDPRYGRPCGVVLISDRDRVAVTCPTCGANPGEECTPRFQETAALLADTGLPKLMHPARLAVLVGLD